MVPEFSRPQRVDALPSRGKQVEISASEAERAALAERFGILAVDSLSASLRLTPVGRGPLVRLRGTLVAEVAQACVVTLDPVPGHVEASFDMTFGPAAAEGDEDGEIDLAFDSEDPPDPIVDGAIDLGEAVAEQLSLALEPFPRAPGAEFAPPDEPDMSSEEKPNPFAALAALRKNEG